MPGDPNLVAISCQPIACVVGFVDANTPQPRLDGGSVAHFIIELDAVAPFDVEIAYHTVDGTALAGVDYDSRTSVLVIKQGQLRGDVAIICFGQLQGATEKTFFLMLDPPPKGVLVDSKIPCRILPKS